MFIDRFNRLLLIPLILFPVSLLGLLIEPMLMATLLSPPTGRTTPENVLHPKTARDYIQRATRILWDAKVPTAKDFEQALGSANTAIALEPDNGDAFVCRAYIYAEMGDRVKAIGDVDTAQALYEREGNGRGLRQISEIIRPQIESLSNRPVRHSIR